MKLTLYRKVEENYEECLDDETPKCSSCDSLCNKKYKTYLYNTKKIIHTCRYCNIALNFKKEYLIYVILVKTDLSQLDIIKKTNKYFDKNKTIIMPLDLDKNMKRININIYRYLLNGNKEYSIVFTHRVFEDNDCLVGGKNIFGKAKKIRKYDLSYYDMPIHGVKLAEKPDTGLKEVDEIYASIERS